MRRRECASLDFHHRERHVAHGEILVVAGLRLKNKVYDGIHVCDGDFAIVVHIGCGTVGSIIKNGVDYRVHVGDIHLVIAVHVTV